MLTTCRLYNVFGSGASHAIHAIFIGHSAAANNGRKVGLLRGSGTRFASWFYAMFRCLRQENPLLASVHCAEFRKLVLFPKAKRAANDVMNKKYFKAMYTLLRAVFSALRLLRYCDSNTPAMDKVYMLSHRTTVAIEKSVEALNDEELFGDAEGMDSSYFEEEAQEVYGDSGTSNTENEDDNDR